MGGWVGGWVGESSSYSDCIDLSKQLNLEESVVVSHVRHHMLFSSSSSSF